MGFREVMDEVMAAAIRLARDQSGVIARDQARALGLTPRRWDGLVVQGWRPAAYGVLVAPWAATSSERTLAMVAGLAARPGGVTAATALRLLGASIPRPSHPVVVVFHGRRGPMPRGIDVRRSRTLELADLRPIDGTPAVTPERAFLDLAAMQPVDVLREALIDARQRRIVSPERVAERAELARGMTGRPRLLAAVRDVTASGADSPFTAMVQSALVRAGLRPDPHPRVVPVTGRTLHPDITFASGRVAIECDSLAFHSDQRALDMDARKHNAYRLSGWTALRITWRRYQRDLDGFVSEVRRALDQR